MEKLSLIYLVFALPFAWLGLSEKIFPNLSLVVRRVLFIISIIIAVLIVFFNSDTYKHWKYFDGSKFIVECHQIAPIIDDGKNFNYKYLVVIQNKYPNTINIANIKILFNSTLENTSHEILLNDIPNNSVKISSESSTTLSSRIESIKGGQLLSFVINCVFYQKNKIKGLMYTNSGANVSCTYDLFGKTHQNTFYVNPAQLGDVISKKSIVFDVIKCLDNRILPDFFFTYSYYNFKSANGDRSLNIYCGDPKKKLLKIAYKYSPGVDVLQSEKIIHNDIDLLRVTVLENRNILVYSTLGAFCSQEIVNQFELGKELCKKKDYKAGAKAFKKVTELDPQYSHAWFNYGLALVYTKDYKSSIEALKQAIKLKMDYADAHSLLGYVLLINKDELEGIEHLKQALVINPKLAMAYFLLGCAQQSEGKSKEAYLNLNKAIEYETKHEFKNIYKKYLYDFQTSKSWGLQPIPTSPSFID